MLKDKFLSNLLLIDFFSTSAWQPEVSKYCEELMPLLLGYLSSLNQSKVGHVTKAFYALENFMENLGKLEKRFLSSTSAVEPAHTCPTYKWKNI